MKKETKKRKIMLYVFFFFLVFSFSEKASALTFTEVPKINTGTGTGSIACADVPNDGGSLYNSYTASTPQLQDNGYVVHNGSTKPCYENGYNYSIGTTYPFLIIQNITDGVIYYADFSDTEQASSTRIIAITSPDRNSITASTNVTFSFKYFATGADGYDTVGRELQDITSGFNYLNKEQNIIASGESTFSTTTSLSIGHYYLWRAYLRDSTGTESNIYTAWNSFEVVSASASSTEITLSNSTTTINFLSFLNVPNLLKTKVPFAYIPQIYNIITGADAVSTTTATTSTLNFRLASGTSAQRDITQDMFSSTTFHKFLSDDIINLFRTIMVAVLYLTTGIFLFHDARDRRHLF